MRPRVDHDHPATEWPPLPWLHIRDFNADAKKEASNRFCNEIDAPRASLLERWRFVIAPEYVARSIRWPLDSRLHAGWWHRRTSSSETGAQFFTSPARIQKYIPVNKTLRKPVSPNLGTGEEFVRDCGRVLGYREWLKRNVHHWHWNTAKEAAGPSYSRDGWSFMPNPNPNSAYLALPSVYPDPYRRTISYRTDFESLRDKRSKYPPLARRQPIRSSSVRSLSWKSKHAKMHRLQNKKLTANESENRTNRVKPVFLASGLAKFRAWAYSPEHLKTDFCLIKDRKRKNQKVYQDDQSWKFLDAPALVPHRSALDKMNLDWSSPPIFCRRLIFA